MSGWPADRDCYTKPHAQLTEAERAFWWADTTEWLHGRQCGSIDCQTCIELMADTDAAYERWQAELKAAVA